jgi:hypothetical protein
MTAGDGGVRTTQKKYASRAMAVAIIAAFFCILMEEKAVGKGLVLGTLFSAVSFIVMGEILPRQVGNSRAKTFSVSLGSVFIRYALLAAPLIVSLKMEQFNTLATIVGIFMIQLMIISDHFFSAIATTFKHHI